MRQATRCGRMESPCESSVSVDSTAPACESDDETPSAESGCSRSGESLPPYQSSSSAPELEEIDQLVGDTGESDVSPDFGRAIATVFDIQCAEMRTYLALLDHPSATLSELGEVLDRSESNVHNRLTSLREKGLVSRERRPVETGGDVYYYTAQPLEETGEWMEEQIEEWSDRLGGQIRRLIDNY